MEDVQKCCGNFGMRWKMIDIGFECWPHLRRYAVEIPLFVHVKSRSIDIPQTQSKAWILTPGLPNERRHHNTLMTPIRPGTELQGTALSVILEDLRRAHNVKVLQRNTVRCAYDNPPLVVG